MINSDQLVGLQLSNTSKQFKNTIKYLKLCHLLIRTTVWMTRPTFTVRYLLLLLLNMLLLILKKVDGQATLGTMIELKVDLLCLCILESWFVLCYGCVWASNSQQNLKASFWWGLGVKKLQFLTLALLNDDEAGNFCVLHFWCFIFPFPFPNKRNWDFWLTWSQAWEFF